ncbi:MAG: ATP-binding protein [Gemmatimonadales bacterium]
MFRDWPIARRLTAMLLGISGFALLLTSASFAAYQYWSFRRTALNNLTVRAEILAANSTAALAFFVEEDAQETLTALSADPHVVAAALYDAEGALFARYPADLPDSLLPSEPASDGFRFESGRLVGYQPVAEASGSRLGTLYLASDLQALYETFWLSGIIGAGVFLLSLLAAYLPSRMLQSTISQPIKRLAETAQRVSNRQDYSVRAPAVVGGGELSELTDSFNGMIGRIEAQSRELMSYAAELEERVQERTHALEEANEALRLNAASLTLSNKELDAFAYSVSHDLRAPLRSIDGFSHVLLEDYADKLDDTARDYLGRVRAATQRMGLLIDDLLRLARISRVEMNRETVDVTTMAAHIAAELMASQPEREVEFAIAPGLEAWADRRLLQVVLDNLIRNSWKYTGKKPTARIEVDQVQANGARAFRVRDNGAGFDMKYAGRLFGEFQRLHAATEFEGTGVGLATVRRIVSRHDGTIWAEGVVGEGATFYFTLAPSASENGGSNS